MKKVIQLFCLISVLCSSCFYDVEEEIYGDQCSDLPAAYSGAVLNLLQTNCLQCHSNASREGGITLEGYDAVIPYINDGSLLGSIEQSAGYSPMPQNMAKMRACDIEKFRGWIEEGSQDN